MAFVTIATTATPTTWIVRPSIARSPASGYIRFDFNWGGLQRHRHIYPLSSNRAPPEGAAMAWG